MYGDAGSTKYMLITLLLVALGSGLILIYLLLMETGSSPWLSVANQVGPALLLGTCLWGAYRFVRNSPLALWTPFPWFLTACAAYFGFGPLVYHFGSAETVSFIEGFYQVDGEALLRTNLLNAVGITAVAGSFLLGIQALVRKRSVRVRRLSHIEIRRLIFVFLAVGISVKFLFALPHHLGLLSWTLPGGVQHLSSLSKIAIILLFVLIQRGFRHYRWLLYGLVGVELVAAFATFSKFEIIEVILAVGLGWYLRRPKLRALVLGGTAVVLLYALILSPFISFARVTAGALGVGSALEVGESVVNYAATPREDFTGFVPGVQGWWARLSYSNAQAFAMDAYDGGTEGDSVDLAFYAFLPRVLFPDKPLMTPGLEFTGTVLGDDMGTNTAPGFFAEAYWNAGWMLVALVCLYVGVLFALLTVFAEHVIAAEKYEYLPIVMLSIKMGYRPDDWFAATYVGALANVVVLYVVMRYIAMPLIRVRRERNPHGAELNA